MLCVFIYMSKGPFEYLNIYPPGSKCKALRLGVHLILLYFIRISLLTPKIFVLFSGRWGVGGVQLFCSLNLLIIIQYILQVLVYMYTKGILAEKKAYVHNLAKLETVPMKPKILLFAFVFGFSSKTSFFVGLGALFGTFLVLF